MNLNPVPSKIAKERAPANSKAVAPGWATPHESQILLGTSEFIYLSSHGFYEFCHGIWGRNPSPGLNGYRRNGYINCHSYAVVPYRFVIHNYWSSCRMVKSDILLD